MWDPWTGRIVQFYPANQSARALRNAAGGVETNRQGSACIQIEIFFSPGAVRGGKQYMTVAETPCVGLDKIVAWLRSWKIPDVWPGGWPTWESDRSAAAWGKAGHFGHSQVPENTHEDPGPMPRDMFGKTAPARPKPPRLLKLADPLMHGDDVTWVQRRLNAHGAELAVDGVYGPRTVAEVKAFQRKAKLTADGVVGPKTRAALA